MPLWLGAAECWREPWRKGWRRPAPPSPSSIPTRRTGKPALLRSARRGAKAIAIQGDASRKEDLERALGTVLGSLGSVDILVNAAGINSGTPFFEIAEAEWQRILDVNLKSVFLACQVFGKRMVECGQGGSIINISSASSGPPLSKVFTYSVTKAGVNQITQFLAREWAPFKVRVNAIRPGFFPAEQNRALLTPETHGADHGAHPVQAVRRGQRTGRRRDLPGFREGRLLRDRLHPRRRRRLFGHDDLIWNRMPSPAYM